MQQAVAHDTFALIANGCIVALAAADNGILNNTADIMHRSAGALGFAELDEAIGDGTLAIMHGATATRCDAITDGTMVKNAICLQHGSTTIAVVSGVLQCQAIAVCRNFILF